MRDAEGDAVGHPGGFEEMDQHDIEKRDRGETLQKLLFFVLGLGVGRWVEDMMYYRA